MRRGVGLALSWAVFAAGCDSVTIPSAPRTGVPVDPPPGGGGGNAAAVLARHCTWCHTTEHPAARIDLQSGRLTPTQLDDMGRGVQLEMAPFISRLPSADKRTLLDWVRSQGGTVPVVSIPTQYTWRLADAIANVPDGSPAPGFAFVVEDGFIDEHAWTVQSSTGNDGRTFRGIELDQSHSVDQSVFPSSRNPSSYLVFKGIPWHGRFKNSRIEGDVRVHRWMSIGLHARELEPLGRDHRQYVRLQIDRDAISMRSAPMHLETWPWGDVADPRLSGNTNASGFYLTSGPWLHVVFQARSEPGGVRWSARVTNTSSGQVLADLSALETDSDPLMGTFFLHGYSVSAGKVWANLVFTADIDQGD
jgi:hypothetical protein